MYWVIKLCEPHDSLQHSKMTQTPDLSKICPDDCFSGIQSEALEFVRNLVKNRQAIICGQILITFRQIPVPLIGTLRNNSRDKFGVWGVSNAVRGRRVRKSSCKGGEREREIAELSWCMPLDQADLQLESANFFKLSDDTVD